MEVAKQNKVMGWEEHLVSRAVAGDEIALNHLLDIYRPILTRQAMRILHNIDDAYDAVQDTIMKAVKALPDFDPERPLRPWLSRICSNVCIDITRNRRHRTECIDDYEFGLIDENSASDELGDASLRRRQLMAAVAQLPRNYRDIILMRHFRQMEVLEIAEALDQPEGTVKSLLFRARTKLRKQLEPAFA